MSYRSGDSDGDCTGGSSGSSESSSESSDEPEQSSQPAPASVKKQRRYTCDLCRARKVRLTAVFFSLTGLIVLTPKTKNQGCSAWTARQENAHVPRAHRPRQQGRSKRMRVVAGGSLGHGAASALPRPAPPHPRAPHQHPSSAPAPYLPRRRDISFPVIHMREPGTFLGVPMRHGRGA